MTFLDQYELYIPCNVTIGYSEYKKGLPQVGEKIDYNGEKCKECGKVFNYGSELFLHQRIQKKY